MQMSENQNEPGRPSSASGGLRVDRRSPARQWLALGLAVAGATTAWLAYSYPQTDATASAVPAPLPQVVVSKPLVREVGSRLGFLGQFSAIEQVELRAQVGGALVDRLCRAEIGALQFLSAIKLAPSELEPRRCGL